MRLQDILIFIQFLKTTIRTEYAGGGGRAGEGMGVQRMFGN